MWDQHTGDWELNCNLYKEKIRPLLYKHFHLLEDNVARSVQEIDTIFHKWGIYEEADDSDDEFLSGEYLKIISSIQNELQNYRDVFINKKLN